MGKIRKRIIKKTSTLPSDPKPDSGADKSGTDKDSDSTKLPDPKKEKDKFDKPKREVDPDRTHIKKPKGKASKISPNDPSKTSSERR